jgi:hypothetical protein
MCTGLIGLGKVNAEQITAPLLIKVEPMLCIESLKGNTNNYYILVSAVLIVPNFY